ncbi:DUF2199 domain-containing protein [Aestuariivirga sp. YIM B02566]|uniref:DUF2199 domain-containing protein n=1 Tax=Taklimakanibacter albus TaxID=2800327 RepID=A0ACC5R1M0_9HYPH|nr:DUF2199 domain-containing protein [Aestuariivirga sp. YIM B02566]MBK1866533.1 DUF2199 domain-containing protein [Aestuariivirga sp. YIM B02566]
MTRHYSSFPDSLRYKCASCEEIHSGLPDITFASPAYWKDGLDPETSRLTSDLCKIEDEDFFLRCLLEIPIRETNVSLGWGVWSSVSRANFDLYVAEYDSDNPSGPFFGWFSNSLPGYAETLSLKCSLQPQNSGLRPILELEPADHQLAIDQRDGITVERALEFIELCGLRVLSV